MSLSLRLDSDSGLVGLHLHLHLQVSQSLYRFQLLGVTQEAQVQAGHVPST